MIIKLLNDCLRALFFLLLSLSNTILCYNKGRGDPMRKLGILCLSALFLLSGCNSADKKEKEALSNYNSFMEAIIENKGAESTDVPFKHTLEVTKEDDGTYRYTITISDPKVAMYDIEMMAYDKTIDSSKEWMPNLGVYGEAEVKNKYTMIPYQSKSPDYVKGIQLSGISSTPKISINCLVTWKDYVKLNTTKAFFNYTYEYKEPETAVPDAGKEEAK